MPRSARTSPADQPLDPMGYSGHGPPSLARRVTRAEARLPAQEIHMNRLAFVAVALLLAACSDDPARERSPTAPPAPTFSRSGHAPRGLSTVCLSYMTQLANTQEKLQKLEKEPVDVALEKKLAKKAESFQKLVTDACR
jgi:hypothetical protein